MAEAVRDLQELIDLPNTTHWFCPRTHGADDQERFFDEDVSDALVVETEQDRETRHKKIAEAQGRKKQVFGACVILAYDGSDAQTYAEKLKERLKQQLGRCTICIREFHRSRSELEHELGGQYDESEVKDFMQRFDTMNIERITSGLDNARDTLLDLAPDERTITALPPAEMFVLLESMHCVQLLHDEDLMQAHFDAPFRLVQTKKKISLPEFVPAMTAFLFSPQQERLQWALRGFKKFKRNMTGTEFEFTAKDTLKHAMDRVSITALEKDFLPLFWRGVCTIVTKLDKEVITNHLRGMDTDIFKLALDHLQIESVCYFDLLASLRLLLERDPASVWDAFGAISPQTIVEQIFNNPSINLLLSTADEDTEAQMEASLGWLEAFVTSIKPANLPPATRAILNQLWVRLQGEKYPAYSRKFCWRRGLESLATVLAIMNRSRSISSAVIADMIEMVRVHIFTVLSDLDRCKDSPSDADQKQLGLRVIEYSLALDCHTLALDRDSTANTVTLSHDINLSSLTIWKAAVRGVKAGNISLASAIISGTRKLLVLEPLTKKKLEAAPKKAAAWNGGLARGHSYVLELLERMQDFDATSIQSLFASRESTTGFFAMLFSGNQDIQQAAAAVLKVASSESSRREGIRFALQNSYAETLHGFALTLRGIARAQVFTPSLTVIKLGTDFLEGLCDSETGVLRSKTLSAEESKATEYAWQSLWEAIGMIFECTEHWSVLGHDKNILVDFCKDAMDFADQAFDKYSVFSGALHNSAAQSEDRKDLDRRLLEVPRIASGNVVKWLRLRDEYLVSKAVTISCSIMGRLSEVDMELSEESTFFIDDVIAGSTRSKLTTAQKAMLREAMDKHLGRTPPASPSIQTIKPQKQGSLSSWVSAGNATAYTQSVDKKKPAIDMDAWKTAAARSKDHKSEEELSRRAVIAGASSTYEKLKAAGGLPMNRSVAPGMNKAAQQQQATPNDFRRKRLEEQEAKRKRDQAVIAAAKRGTRGLGEAGSGLAGLGVEGKDHSVRGQGVMVSSDEESDEDDDDLDAELFGTKPKSAARKDNVRLDAAGAIGLKVEQRRGPVKLQRQVRSHKDMRARIAPDLSPLHKIILSWDFFHEGDYPQNSNEWQFKKVSNSFRHVGEYKDTFQPLLTLEAWQGFVRSREENSNKPYEIKIGSRSSVDAFLEISTSISHAENREIQVSDGDVILFSTSSNPTSSADAAHCLARVYRINRKKQHLEVIYRVMPGTSLNSSLTPGSVIHGTKLQSLTPLEREYGALSGLQYYDLCDEVIKAKPSPLLNYTDKQLDPLIANYTVNKAQAKAIKSAVDNDAFTLIQGPPGSGKTKTIVAIVGALLTDSLSSQQTSTRIVVPQPAGAMQSGPSTTKKLLVCAPSNAAVDELVMRFKEGVKTSRGVHKNINIVRLGRSDAINTAVVDVTMDELVNKRLGSAMADKSVRERTQALMIEHKNVSEQLRLARDQVDGGKVKGEEQAKLQEEFNQLRRRKNALGTQIDNAKDAENAASRTADLAKKKVQQAVLDESHVICATLSGSGHDMFQSLNIEFETVIVDEAAQCVEMSALIPLKYGCAKCILVGDPKQLPPTVFSKEAARFQYEQSLFVRMQGNFPDAVHLLDTQYRMHPDISAFPSATFYDGRLLDGPDMEGLRQKTWHQSSLLAPYRFFDVEGQHQSAPKGHSLINRAEIDVALALYQRLTSDFKSYDFTKKIGIITPYKSQLRELKERFASRYGDAIFEAVDFNTTDAFQGRESDVIIFSCVRASPAGNIGFLQDIRRMNVGLTRAKSSLWVLGNSNSLMRGEFWNKLVVDAKERDLYTGGNLHAMLQQPSSSFPVKSKARAPKSAQKVPTYGATPSNAQETRSVDKSGLYHHTIASSNITSSLGATNGNGQPADLLSHGKKTAPASTKMEDTETKQDIGLHSDQLSLPDPSKGRSKAQPAEKDIDVEMEDADGATTHSGTMTPQEPVVAKDRKRPRSETPASGGEKRPPPAQRPKPQPTGPFIPRKKKPADPFIKKKPRTG